MSRRSLRPLPVLSWALPLFLIAVLGAVHIPFPLHGDAALYQVGARAMADGDTLYRDFWDLKQPGIYVFHWLAGRLFGFSEAGLHTFELLVHLCLAVAQIFLLRRVFQPAWLASLVPVVSAGVYYCITTDWHLTQPAVLLSVPLSVVLAALAIRWRFPRIAWGLAGAAAATAIAFKIVVAPLLLLLVIVGTVYQWSNLRGERNPYPWRCVVTRRLAPFAIGFTIVSLFGITWLQFHGGWDWFVWTHTSWRAEALVVRGEHPVDRVVESTKWFIKRFAPWILLSWLPLLAWRKLLEEPLFVLSVVWLTAGLLLIAVEPFAGWEFDFLMLLVPLALVAVRGLQMVTEKSTKLAFCLGALALLPGIVEWVPKARQLALHADRLREPDSGYQRAIDARYEQAFVQTQFLREGSSPESSIYVFGDPLFILLSGRKQASPVHGWAWELQPSEVWRRVEGDLRGNRPEFIFVAASEDATLDARGPGIRNLLDSDYRVRSTSGLGTWYEASPQK